MPILQNKLVMKSIEALHDEALSLMPDTARNRGVTEQPAVLHATKPPQDSPIDMPKDMSGVAPIESAGDLDIMARIDHLLKKLDEVEDAVDMDAANRVFDAREGALLPLPILFGRLELDDDD